MGRKPCCEKVGLKKGAWSGEEDKKLITFILTNGHGCWRALPKLAGLLRCGKSCRLRWTNYLRPDLKRGLLSEYEEQMVIHLHAQLGNRWSKIASHLPGRTDNEIKSHWNTHIKKKLRKMGIDPLTHNPLLTAEEQKKQVGIFKETETSLESTINEAKEEDGTLFDPNNVDVFCIDEVPLIQPHEILLPSSCTNSSKFLQDLHYFPADFEWPSDSTTTVTGSSNLSLWDIDGFSSWDLLINNDDDSDRKLALHSSSSLPKTWF
ncbi:hypothetical protein HRI_003740200 [Hibiscus trionum]|uniref:Uncharacterized protein n=1 Tax=Hibiscus trionum TaxID=183268 RepID=A0A9W7IQ95_HIBTR|nr:hypothetical protein HRI_003740200 [Hibiscus trionum]